MRRKRVALISVWFAPNSAVAVNRMDAFAKYLGSSYELEVFTLGKTTRTEQKEFGTVHYFSTNRLMNKLEHNSSEGKLIHFFKTALNVVANKFGVSKYDTWKKKATKAVMSRQTESPFDVVISSYAPIEPHDIAFEIKQKYPKVKWITDMRDEMSKNPFISSRVRTKLEQRESKFANEIDALITVSEPILKDFKTIFPKVDYFEEVRNGFDHDVMPSKDFNDKFTIVYAGTFYSSNKPVLFFKQLESLINSGEIGQDIQMKFVGTHKNFDIPSSLVSFVEFIPKVKYLKAIEFMRNADCNLIQCPPFDTKGRYTGKLFDYLSVERPILGLLDKEDVAAELIWEHQAGFVADFNDEGEIRKALLDAYNLWKNKEYLPIKSDKTKELHRKHQVDKLKQLIESMDND